MTCFPKFAQLTGVIRVVTVFVGATVMPAFTFAQVSEKRISNDANSPAVVQAEQMSGRPDREIVLERNVEITRGETTIHADKATYRIVEGQVEANGNIQLQRLGDCYTGDDLKLQLDTGRGYILQPTYHLQRNNAQGKAARIDFEAEDRAIITQGIYSTCEGPNPDWYLYADTMRLDSGRDLRTAGKTILYFQGAPILGVPAMSFPLSEARKSGVLPPSIGTTNKGGLEITVPYYFNIAPNRDLTLYPNIIARRGLQMGADARYLSDNGSYSGQTKLEFLLDDHQTKTNRYAFSSIHAQTLMPGLTWAWNINTASDDDYPSDFSRTITTSAQRLLLRDMTLNYGGNYWNAGARLSNYQVLQDAATPITRPYDRLPQLTFQIGRQDVRGFDWLAETELTRFWHPDLVRGTRFSLNPKVSYPIIHPSYFVTPKLSFDVTQYALDSSISTGSSNFTRSLPTFSIDSGLVFERDANFFGQAMIQALEPRLFYVKTPFRDQSMLPNFDTAEADLSFSQLFSENRFIGRDRISDANQLTVALVTRYIELTGEERMRFALGQRFYFSEQRVNLMPTSDVSRTDLLLSASGHITKHFNAEANMQYSAISHTLTRANFGVRWQPAPKRIVNVQYRRDLLNNLEQVDTSAQWPVASRWYGVGRFNYSLFDQKIVEALVGMEYKADCWVFRFVAQRIPTSTATATSAIFLQLELNGLTRLGSNPLDALKMSIPGYQVINKE